MLKYVRTFGWVMFWTALLGIQAVTAQSTPEWGRTFEDDVEWYNLTDAGVLVVKPDDILHAVSPTTGESLWQNGDERKKADEDEHEHLDRTFYVSFVGRGLGALVPHYIALPHQLSYRSRGVASSPILPAVVP